MQKGFPIQYEKRTLQFIKPAKTSKQAYNDREIIIVSLIIDGHLYEGECAPLPHLSIETLTECAEIIQNIEYIPSNFKDREELLLTFPSALKFAIEGIFIEHALSNTKIKNDVFAINGLIWMNDFEQMWDELLAKVELGFDCIKVKIGQHDFDAECRFLEKIRLRYRDEIELRLDANGAFEIADAASKLKELQRFGIHSIEQPIAAGNWEAMQEICAKSKIPIALDEELIGIKRTEQTALLQKIKPQYLIFKPTLHGGFSTCDQWIKNAIKYDVKWWVTSALESNIGLYQIALWLSQYHNKLPQGLGTGSLFKENYERPLLIKGNQLKIKSMP